MAHLALRHPRRQRRGLVVPGGDTAPSDPTALLLALARLHWATTVGARVEVDVPPDLIGRAGAPHRLADLVEGAGFVLEGIVAARSRPRARVRRLRTLPDTVGPGMRALVCGLNPSLAAADAGYGYAGATNRFWPVALEAGLVSAVRDPVHALEVDKVGMTDLVKRSTPSAVELRVDEYRAGAERVARLVAWLQPGLVLFVGLAGWRAAIDRRAVAGWQPAEFAGVRAYVMPSTSGLNAHASRATLVGHVRVALACESVA